jgi:aspartate-alanine antiporter
MAWIEYAIKNAPEAFLLLALAIGTVLGRIRIRGFAIGSSACILIVAVLIGQLGTFVIPPLLRSLLFGLFVFTIGYRSGPEFFASLSVRTLAQVVLALVMGLCGLIVVLTFTYALHFDPGTAAGVAAGSLTQTSMMGTASGALSQLGLEGDLLKTYQGSLAAGYAVTYILGYILVLLYVPLVAPVLMGVSLKKEASKLEAELSGGGIAKTGNLLYRKFQTRAYQISTAANQTVGEIEKKISRRVAVERILRGGEDVEPRPEARLQAGDEILLAGPSSAIVAAGSAIGTEIEGEYVMRAVPGRELEVFITARELHGLTLSEIVGRLGGVTRGVFLRSLKRHDQDVPVVPSTRIYVGDVMTLVGVAQDLDRLVPKLGQAIKLDDRTDIAFFASGLAVGLLIGLLSIKVGPVVLTLGGGGGALIAGLVFGWWRARRPTMGAFPPAARQVIVDLGLGGFIAAIGLANGPAALAAIQSHGLTLLATGVVVTLTPMVVGTLFAYHVLRMNPVIVCGALAGAMTVDAAVAGACEVAESQTPVLGVAVPYAIANVVLTVLGPIIVGLTFAA